MPAPARFLPPKASLAPPLLTADVNGLEHNNALDGTWRQLEDEEDPVVSSSRADYLSSTPPTASHLKPEPRGSIPKGSTNSQTVAPGTGVRHGSSLDTPALLQGPVGVHSSLPYRSCQPGSIRSSIHFEDPTTAHNNDECSTLSRVDSPADDDDGSSFYAAKALAQHHTRDKRSIDHQPICQDLWHSMTKQHDSGRIRQARNKERRWTELTGSTRYHVRCSKHRCGSGDNNASIKSTSSLLEETRASCSRRSEFSGGSLSIEFLPDLTGQISRDAPHAISGGGYADVWKGTWTNDIRESTVAIKALRIYLSESTTEHTKKDRLLRREIYIWTKLDHANVVPLFGVTYDFGPYPAMVSPWQENGTLNEFIEQKHDSLSSLERSRMIIEIAEGLEYLHDYAIIHGDLTGSNVMINSEGTCLLSDFGLSMVLEELHIDMSSAIHGAVRWAAPELYRLDWDPAVPRRSTMNDIYSLGSLILQILSGKMPYYGDNDMRVVMKLALGTLPEPPAGTSISLFYREIMQRCWARNPTDRPDVSQALEYLCHPGLSTEASEW